VRTTILVALLLAPSPAWAHAFPDHSDPRVGHTVDAAPTQVRIWFDGEIEPLFSTIRVENARGQRVDKGDGHVDAKDNTVLEATVRPGLAPGEYRVFWSVIARDGHRTEGDYPFRIK
jgi:copper resistance protein C